MPVHLISWNVNGLRACMGKGFMDFINGGGFDVIGLQETKMRPEQADFNFPDYHAFWYSAEKKGYSGTLVLSKQEPLSVSYGIGIPEHDKEGRVITLAFPAFYFVNVYTPNAQHGLTRLDYRMAWEDAFRAYVSTLNREKPVVICGDLNVAHQEIDLKHPKRNVNNPGFTQQERDKLTGLLNEGFMDTFRRLYPDRRDAYTWWSYMGQSRTKNVGWRIDYFLASERLAGAVKDALIYDQVTGSDHCPVGLILDL